jgi:hypothetical protein
MRLALRSLGLWVLLAACAAQPTASPDPRTVHISRQQAIDAVVAFLPGTANLVVDGPNEGALHRFYTVRNADLTTTVDAFDGRVISLTLPNAMPQGNTVAVTKEQAEDRAAAFMNEHGLGVGGELGTVTLVEHGDFSEYEVIWQSTVRDIRVPDRRSVSVDPATGAVFGFRDDRRSWDPPPEPKIGRDDAIARAKASVSQGTAFRSPVIDRALLIVDFAPEGTQLLVWEIGLSSGESHVLMHVDALSGAVTVIGAA